MTNTVHTPGPWRYENPSIGSNYARIFFSADEKDGDNLCGYCGEANARLIAASPELLEALELILTADQRGFGLDYIKGCARAAIAKATAQQ